MCVRKDGLRFSQNIEIIPQPLLSVIDALLKHFGCSEICMEVFKFIFHAEHKEKLINEDELNGNWELYKLKTLQYCLIVLMVFLHLRKIYLSNCGMSVLAIENVVI